MRLFVGSVAQTDPQISEHCIGMQRRISLTELFLGKSQLPIEQFAEHLSGVHRLELKGFVVLLNGLPLVVEQDSANALGTFVETRC